MTITTRANGEQVNLATVLNGKLEAPILQTEMGLNVLATATGHAVRWNEWSVKHNNDGSFKGIDIADMNLTTSATATKKPIRWDEFSNKHNNDGTFKAGVISNTEINLTASATAIGKAIRWDEFSVKFNNDGTFKAGVITSAEIAGGAITQAKVKTKSAVALADAVATLTATQMIDSGIFTITPTLARTLTSDTAVNIVAGLSGYQVGTCFEFTIVNNGAFDVTLVGGTGVTITGKAIANNTSITFLARIDSATTVTIYRKDGALAAGSIVTGYIADNAVTSAKIANATITNTQISATAGITGSQLANATLTDAQISTTAAIVASKLAIQKMYKKSPTANPSATINTYGTQVDLTPPTGYVSVLPRAVDIVFGGTFGSETVTTDIIVTFSDATTATISKTATAVGTTSLTNTELMTLAKDDVYINKISLKSKSSIASSVATVTVNHFGYYL